MAPVVTIRAAAPADWQALGLLASGSARLAGDAMPEAWDLSHELWFSADETQVAEGDEGLIGAYRLHLRNAGSSLQGELLLFAVTLRGRRHGVDLLLVHHMTRQAVASGMEEVYVVARPPHDTFFRRLGAELMGVEAPGGDDAGPKIRLALSVSDLSASLNP